MVFAGIVHLKRERPRKGETCELLVGYEGNSFDFTGNAERELLAIAGSPHERSSSQKFFAAGPGELGGCAKGWSIKEISVKTE